MKKINVLIKIKLVYLLLLSFFLLSSCSKQPELIKISGNTMGTTYSIVVVTNKSKMDKVLLKKKIDNLLSCFKAAIPMEGSLPALLGEALEKVFEEHPKKENPPIMAAIMKNGTIFVITPATLNWIRSANPTIWINTANPIKRSNTVLRCKMTSR